jgi:hypothetical protein
MKLCGEYVFLRQCFTLAGLTFCFELVIRQVDVRQGFAPVVFTRAEGLGAGTAAGHCLGGDALMPSVSCFFAGGASFKS